MTQDDTATEGYAISWERHLIELDPGDGWVHTEPSGASTVSCTCGYDSGPIKDSDVQAAMDTHRATHGGVQ